jgi:hypothetical protein
MGTADNGDLGRVRRTSRGQKSPARRKFSSAAPSAKDFAVAGKTFGNSRSGAHAKKTQIERAGSRSRFMSQFIDRYPTAAIWLFAILQGAAMLGLNVLLRALVS